MRPDQSRPALLALGTAVPAYRIEQAQLCRWMIDSLREPPALGRWLQWLYDHTRRVGSGVPDGLAARV